MEAVRGWVWIFSGIAHWSVNSHWYWLSVIYTVSLDVIGNVDSRNEYTMNSKRKDNGDHYKVCESLVADGIVG